ncbi:MAG: hypothetical protein WC951_03860 [Bacteroidales bacterium]
MITKDILVEEIVEDFPNAIPFLRDKGLVCIQCGEAVWGTLNDLAKSKGFTEDRINEIVAQLNELKG